MLILVLNILYVLIAVSMTVLILLQRGAGAQAGSGFGAGASGTVFGSQGSASFLSKSTKWLGVSFFVLTLLMAWMNVKRPTDSVNGAQGSVMANAPVAAPVTNTPVKTDNTVPQAPASSATPVPQAPATAAPAQNTTPNAENTTQTPSQKP